MSPKYFSDLKQNPSITITPSYIDDRDFFHPYVKEIIADPNAAIYLVGYQDPRSIGGMIKNSDEINFSSVVTN